MKSRHNLAQEG